MKLYGGIDLHGGWAGGCLASARSAGIVEAESTRYRSRSWRGGEASLCRSLTTRARGT